MRAELILLPAALCDEALYRDQIDGLGDLARVRTLVVAAADLAAGAAEILAGAPERFAVAGTSYGGNLAIEVALAAPDRVSGLWLMGCHAGPDSDPGGASARAARIARGEFPEVVSELAAAMACPRGPAAAAVADAFRRMAERVGAERFLRQNGALAARPDRRDELPRVTAPALLVHGADDAFIDPADAELLAARLPRSRRVVLGACGHLPTLEYPAETTRLARRWLVECVGATPGG